MIFVLCERSTGLRCILVCYLGNESGGEALIGLAGAFGENMMKNKTRLKILISAVVLAGVLSASAAKPPNILFIFTDDQRFDSIGYENPEIQTPHLPLSAQLPPKWDPEYLSPGLFYFP